VQLIQTNFRKAELSIATDQIYEAIHHKFPSTPAILEPFIIKKEHAVKRIPVLVVALFLIGLMTACQKSAPGPGGAMLSDADREAVLAFSEPQVDSMLDGWNADDYAAFSKDFSEEVLKSMPLEQFDKLRNDEFTGLGRYYSREVESVVQRSEGFYTVIYYVVFENNTEVLLRVRFQAEEPHEINGLWFNR